MKSKVLFLPKGTRYVPKEVGYYIAFQDSSGPPGAAINNANMVAMRAPVYRTFSWADDPEWWVDGALRCNFYCVVPEDMWYKYNQPQTNEWGEVSP